MRKKRFIKTAMLFALEKLPMAWFEDDTAAALKCAQIANALWDAYVEVTT